MRRSLLVSCALHGAIVLIALATMPGGRGRWRGRRSRWRRVLLSRPRGRARPASTSTAVRRSRSEPAVVGLDARASAGESVSSRCGRRNAGRSRARTWAGGTARHRDGQFLLAQAAPALSAERGLAVSPPATAIGAARLWPSSTATETEVELCLPGRGDGHESGPPTGERGGRRRLRATCAATRT